VSVLWVDVLLLDREPRDCEAFCCAAYDASLLMEGVGHGKTARTVHSDAVRSLALEAGKEASKAMLRRSGGREKSGALTREAMENRFAGRGFNEVEDGQGEQDQDDVGEPGIQSGEMEPVGHMVGVE
jgi:hypothetical protein